MTVDICTGLATPETIARRATEMANPVTDAKWVAAFKMFDLYPKACLWTLAAWVSFGGEPMIDTCEPIWSCEGCDKWLEAPSG